MGAAMQRGAMPCRAVQSDVVRGGARRAKSGGGATRCGAMRRDATRCDATRRDAMQIMQSAGSTRQPLTFVCMFAALVDVSVKARDFVVKGPRGELRRMMRHVHADVRKVEDGKLRVDVWHGNRKDIAKINTVCSTLKNMIIGVTRGFRYKLRFVYAHFPINVTCSDDKKSCEIRNFLGEKRIRKVSMNGDVVCYRSDKVKDELIVEGSDIELVSQCAAMVHHVCLVKKKDIRKFLDGIYVSEKTHIVAQEE
jgi:large subunit ribosomal protein L9e